MDKTFRIRRAIKSGFPVEINGTLLSKKAYTQLLTDALKVCLKGYVKDTLTTSDRQRFAQEIKNRNIPVETVSVDIDTGETELEIPFVFVNKEIFVGDELDEFLSKTPTGRNRFPDIGLLGEIVPEEDEGKAEDVNFLGKHELTELEKEKIRAWIEKTLSGIDFEISDIKWGDDETVLIEGDLNAMPMKAINIALKMRNIRIKRMLID